jgi:hypothetical protein
MLAQAMSIAAARGDSFLGMPCQQTNVLYVDHENPAFSVQSRLRAMVGEETDMPRLKVCGKWLEDPPPQAGNQVLLKIAKESTPLIVIDPLRFFHDGDENDSTAMAGVMQYLWDCAAWGGAVVLLHHPAKSEGSTGRGSSAIRGACDLALLHTLDKEGSLITLKVDKNRHGASRTITIRADFEQCSFMVTDSPWITSRNQKFEELSRIITAQPGITTNELNAKFTGKKAFLLSLLNEGLGSRWFTRPGPRKSKLFYPMNDPTGSLVPPYRGEPRNQSG